MNEFFRNRLLNSIQNAIAESSTASKVSHKFLVGRIREIVLDDIIRPVLPLEFTTGTGKVTDHTGYQSNEVDLIIYSRQVIAPILYSDRFGMFPADSCFATVSVKSTLTATELEDAINNGMSLQHDKLTHISGYFDKRGNALSHSYTEIFRNLFAFKSDLTVGKKSEFDRYREKDPNWDTYPALDTFCIVGKGYWVFQITGEKPHWIYCAPTNDYDEVFAFLRVLVDSCRMSLERRGYPSIGQYLIGNDKFKPV